MHVGGKTSTRRLVSPHQGPMGNRTHFPEIRSEVRPRPIRRGVGRHVEQHHPRRHKNVEAGNNGPEGLPRRGSNHEETEAPEIDPAVRGVHGGRAHLYHHGTDEERFIVGTLTG